MRRLAGACIVIGLSLASLAGARQDVQSSPASPPATPAAADPVSKAIEAYNAAVKGVPLNGENYEKYRAAANDAVVSLDMAKLGVDDIERLIEPMLIGRSKPQTQKRVDERLAELAKAPTADGAQAAMIRTTINLVETTDDKETWKAYSAEDKRRQLEVMRHPGLAKAVEAGKTKYLFANGSISSDLADEDYAQTVAEATRLPLAPDVAPRLWYMYTPLAEEKATASPATRERVRTACMDRMRQALAAPTVNDKATKTLNDTLRNFDSAYAKGTLVGNVAPELEFLWTDATAGTGTGAPKKLSDLKGKVVVLDFWAVWCGPCVGSFPQVRELQARYKDYPVVILGVTDLAGTPMPEGYKQGDTLDPQVQAAALAAWAKEKEVTWPLAIGSTGVFNPEYGIRGIPHVAILDPEGNVRFRAMHPASEPEVKHARIEGILKEFKLPCPNN